MQKLHYLFKYVSFTETQSTFFFYVGKEQTYNLTKQMFIVEDLHYNITVEIEPFPAAVVHEAGSSLHKSPVDH